MTNRWLLLFCFLLTAASAQAQTPFYQGKTITIVVGTKTGDAYDLYPRMLAEFMPKYIPGNPNIIIQNVPGAASMIDRGQSSLQREQTRWFDDRRHLSGALLRATHQKAGGEIRLDEIRLGRQPGHFEPFAVHALRRPL